MGISGICIAAVGCVVCAQKADVYRRAAEGRCECCVRCGGRAAQSVMPEMESELFEAVLAGPLQILPAPTCPILWSDMTYAAQLCISQLNVPTSILMEYAVVLKFDVFQKIESCQT
jgi:hypothetical protein